MQDDQPKAPENNDELDPKKGITAALVRQVAVLSISGCSPNSIAKTLGITKWYVTKIQADQRHIDIVSALGEEALQSAQRQIKSETAKLAGEVMRVLRELLKKNNVDGLKIAIKLLGLDNREQEAPNTQSLTVILPGQKAPDIVVSGDKNKP